VKRPALPILFVTGFADRTALIGIGDGHIIGKPFAADELIEKVQCVLGPGLSSNVVPLRR